MMGLGYGIWGIAFNIASNQACILEPGLCPSPSRMTFVYPCIRNCALTLFPRHARRPRKAKCPPWYHDALPLFWHPCPQLHPVPLLDHVGQHRVDQALLLEHVEAAKLLGADVDGVHGPAPARHVLDLQLDGRQLGHHAVPDLRLAFCEVGGLFEGRGGGRCRRCGEGPWVRGGGSGEVGCREGCSWKGGGDRGEGSGSCEGCCWCRAHCRGRGRTRCSSAKGGGGGASAGAETGATDHGSVGGCGWGWGWCCV